MPYNMNGRDVVPVSEAEIMLMPLQLSLAISKLIRTFFTDGARHDSS